jgi:DnaJ-class molecular chaperone|tara:strand:+ start:142 stop:1011 length:870 start_codon:yes stop_codon:yes gene_type:complete
MKDYYKILGVGETATNEQIKKAFKDIAKKEHPDRGGNKDRFQEASEAHDTLKDSQKRHDYDTQRKFGGSTRQGRQGQHPFFNEDIFSDFFSGFSGGDMDFNGRFNFNNTGRTRTFRSGPKANRNIQVRMAISIKEAMMHNEKTINYKLPSGREEFATVKIPAGVQHGVTFKFAGMGDDSVRNQPRGDLMVQMSVLDSDGYTRKGNDLYTDKTINCFQAIRGYELKLKTLEDSVITVKVPAGTQHGTLMSVKGRGMPVHRTLNIRGNLYVRVLVLIPQLSTADLKKIKDL